MNANAHRCATRNNRRKDAGFARCSKAPRLFADLVSTIPRTSTLSKDSGVASQQTKARSHEAPITGHDSTPKPENFHKGPSQLHHGTFVPFSGTPTRDTLNAQHASDMERRGAIAGGSV